MPPAAAAIAAAAITGGGAYLASRSASRANRDASRIQARSDAEALQMARDNEVRRRQEYDQANAIEAQERAAYTARAQPYWDMSDALGRRAGRRLGLNVGAMGGMRRPPGAPPGAPQGTPRGAPGTRPVPADPRTIASMAGYTGYDSLNPVFASAPAMIQGGAPQMTIADVANWGTKRRTA